MTRRPGRQFLTGALFDWTRRALPALSATEREALAAGDVWWDAEKRHPAVERKLHAEIDTVLGERPPVLADLPALPFTASTIEETLRLYPPVWLFGRRAIEDDMIGGFHIPAGSALFLSPYFAHRDPRFWDNPEGFDPERFTATGCSCCRRSGWSRIRRSPCGRRRG